MSNRSTKAVSVLFKTPPGDEAPHHERTFEQVPAPVAEEMAEGFKAGRDPSSEVSPYQLYRYEKGGAERLIALDYSEVIGVFVEGPEGPSRSEG